MRRVAAAAVLVVLGAAPPAAGDEDGLVYVALGDSYTSGPLVLPHDRSRVPEDCGQSTRNYPHLAAPLMGATTFVDVSCGSATIDDLYAPQTGLPAGGTNAPQLLAVTPEADVVTIGMGGNDVGFVGLALDCVRFVGPPVEQPCTPEYTAGGRDLISERIAATGPELGQAIRDIQAAAPGAEVFVVSYPTSLPDDGVACWPYLPILPEDMPYLVAKYKEMNAMLAEQAAANGATYIDIYTPSIGHDACKPPPVAWVNGVVVVPPSYPAHPNELGLAASGVIVADAVKARLAAASGPSGPSGPGSPSETTAPPAPGPTPPAVPTGVLARTGVDDAATASLALLGIAALIRRATGRPAARTR
jgi:lysophospholipase L1-like esterase